MIKERVLQVVESKKIGKGNFFAKIGMTSASFRGNARTTPLNSTAIENIFAEIPDLNLEWLITGKGEMLLHGDKKVDVDMLNYIEQKDKKIAELTERAVRAETLLESANSQILHLECRTRSIASDVTAPYNATDTFNPNK